MDEGRKVILYNFESKEVTSIFVGYTYQALQSSDNKTFIVDHEGKLKQVILLTESIIDIENKYVSASHQNTHEFTDSESEVETLQYTDTRLISTPPQIDEMFTSTHTVNARLHLRRSASSESTALAVIEVGSRVEYISQDGDWYYVNVPSYGEGWCSSEYLSTLLENQQYASVI